MSFRIYNITAPLVDGGGRIIPPWNSFFQQFTNNAQPFSVPKLDKSPFTITPNVIGNFFIKGGTVTSINLIRGKSNLQMYTDTTNPRIVPISLADSLSVEFSDKPEITFIQLLG